MDNFTITSEEIEKIRQWSDQEIRCNESITDFQWELISEYRKLDDDFIREFKSKLNLNKVLLYQEIEDKFLKETIMDQCDLSLMIYINKITQKVLYQNINMLLDNM